MELKYKKKARACPEKLVQHLYSYSKTAGDLDINEDWHFPYKKKSWRTVNACRKVQRKTLHVHKMCVPYVGRKSGYI